MAVPRSLSYITQPIARRALSLKHADLGLLLAHWDDIVGDEMAAFAVPDRIAKGRGRGATLHIRVSPGAASRLQHETPRLIARLNSVLGTGAIDSIKLTQGMVGRGGKTARRSGAAERRPTPLPDSDASALAAMLSGVRDPALRSALSLLGENVFRHNPAPQKAHGVTPRRAETVKDIGNTLS